MLLFDWHAVNYGLFFVCACVCVCACARAIKLVKCAHVIKQKDKDTDQYKNCSTVHALNSHK